MDELHHGWIKLEVPRSSTSSEEMNQIVENISSKLEKALQKYDIQVITRQKTQEVEEMDCESYFEVNFEVQSGEFSKDLILAMQRCLNECNYLQAYQRGSFVLHSTDFWSTELNCQLKYVPLSAIYFGNIQGGTFLNHWEISFWEEQKKNQSAMHQIEVDFQFDSNDMILVHFQCLELERNDPAFYRIFLRRESVRRIIVDPTVCDNYGNNRVRLHLELNCPVLINKGFVDKENRSNKFPKPFFRRRKSFDCQFKGYGYPNASAISDSPVFTMEFRSDNSMDIIYRILCRLRIRTGISIEFAAIPSVDIILGRREQYNRWTIVSTEKKVRAPTDENAAIFRDFLAEECFAPIYTADGVKTDRKFTVTYLIECLLSRGAVVKDQLLLDKNHWINFLKLVLEYFRYDSKLCESALEDLVHLIDGRKRIGSISKCFDRICKRRIDLKVASGLQDEEIRDGYVRVCKIVFTPTRVIYVAPETIMGNRVLRKYDKDGTMVLRVVFRDDNNQKMRKSTTGDLLGKAVQDRLEKGVQVANRDYGFLGCSNSQMRDHGAYFMLKYSESKKRRFLKDNPSDQLETFRPEIVRVRKQLGMFEKTESVPKMMARLGQCFTQSRLSGVELPHDTYIKIHDYTGGKGNYKFSDGVGMMSGHFAKMVSESMDFGKAVPSAFQFRFRGMKGMVAIEPLLDDFRRWTLLTEQKGMLELNCAFRPTQIKFPAKRFPKEQIEIVKFSSPVPVSLNKPFINILDQVSEMQSLECHRRVTNRIEELMDQQIQSFSRQLNDETYCRNKLKEFPRRIDIDILRTSWGFTLANEPFFRSLIKASIKFSITKQLRKEQIAIPKELGRSMLGVVDETGRLQYGQIFVQYTKNLALKLPAPTAAREVLQGTVLLTKNPCIVAGDVRIFEAVDIPELHHMCDVVVFPQNGPRPHPDEMAGSDLDGDEYSIIWDQQMLLERNESPFDFSCDKFEEDFDMENIDSLMAEFYIKYMQQDSVGQISNSHLHLSDQYGLNSRVCMDLAKKNCQAVDFTKSGQPPDPLEKHWRTDEKTGEIIPPEVSERIPDFHIGNDRSPAYVSPRLCGRLFREFKAIDDVVQISEERDEQIEVIIDETIDFPGYQEYLVNACEDLANYNAQMRSLMDNYGIRTEGELMSGCILQMRNRISDKDQDDMSFYNTNQMIETKVTILMAKFRTIFFEEFGGYLMLTEPIPNTNDENNILQRRCSAPSNKMMKKAVAWYRACYEEARRTRESRKLSFSWLVYDVIAMVKQNKVLESDDFSMGGANPMFTILEAHRKQYLTDKKDQFEKFCELAEFKEAADILGKYIIRNPGLEKVLFMLNEWATSSECFERTPMRRHHLALLFVLFATQKVPSAMGTVSIYIDPIEEQKDEDFEVKDEMTEMQISEMIVKFLEFLASRKFRKLPFLSFSSLGYSSIYMRGEWEVFHLTALKTYYNILFNLRFEELPVSTDPTTTKRTVIRESEPFVIELPDKCSEQLILDMMKRKTGVESVEMRRAEDEREKSGKGEKKPKKNARFIISSRGSLESLQRLRQLVAVKIPIRSHLTGEDVSDQMTLLCYTKIIAEIDL